MAVKEATQVSANGHVEAAAAKAPAPEARKMAGFQQKYMKRLVDNFERAKAGVQQAQDAANDFIAACAEEEGITLGQDGWTFDVDAMEFVRVLQQEG